MHILRTLRDCLPPDVDPNLVTADTTYLSLAMDSLDFIFYVRSVESALGIEIPNEELPNLKTLRAMEAYLTPVLAGRS